VRDLLTDYERLSATGPVGRAVVTSVWGSAPRLAGASMLATAEGLMAGSVSGGCVEGAVVEAIGTAIRAGRPHMVRFDVSHEQAWAVGLACGGSIEVLVEPAVRPELLEAARGPGGVVVASVVGGPLPLGRPDPSLAGPIADALPQVLASRESRTVAMPSSAGEVSVFLEVYPEQEHLLIIGAVHVAEVLARLARPLGYRVIVADGRAAFLTRERFPDADLLLEAWPAEAFAQAGVTGATSICVLTHDPKFDEPALELALRSPARYIGAIGSRRTQAERRERLRASGFGDADLDRIHGPIGLDLGGRHPAEIALAILAEMTAAKYGKG
jgi:xanthine dehydrogenase accessory factor